MAISDRMEAAVRSGDAAADLALYADDAVLVRHQSGTTMTKAQFGERIRKMGASDSTDTGSRRLICENDEILAVHSINDDPDDIREAVLMACTLTGDKTCRVETGATPLQK